MEKPKRSSFPSGRQGSTKYAAAMKAWRAKQPKRWRPLSALDKDTTAWEKERKSRNPEKRITVGTGRSKKTKIVPNPNYKRPTKGQKGYSPDATSNPRKEVDMEAIRKIVKNLSNKKDKNSNWTNKVSGNGGSSKSTEAKVVKNNEKLKVKPKVDLRKKYTNIVNRQASGKNSVMFQKAKTWLRNNPVK